MKATMTEDRTVRTTITTPAGTTEKAERTVRLDLEDAPLMETGSAEHTYAYLPDGLVIDCVDGGVRRVRTHGRVIKADGSVGKRRADDWFDGAGRHVFYRQRPDAPAEIMAIVEKYL